MKIAFFLLIFLLPLISLGQQSDFQLAYTYYQNKEHDKAADLFLKLYERTHSSSYLDYYVVSLINGKRYDKAEDELKRFLKNEPDNKDFLIHLGYVYEQQGKTKKTEDCYEKAVQKLIPSPNDITNLGYKFRNIREYGWAIQTYLRGQELLKKPNAFLSELGDCYMMDRNYDKMFSLYTQSLQTNPEEIGNIISQLSFARSYDMVSNLDSAVARNLDKTFRTPDYPPIFDELGVWFDLQHNNYPSAMNHAIRLNQLMENKTHIFVNIARAAAAAEQYGTAISTYNKILERGKENNNFYPTARKEIISCRYHDAQQKKSSPQEYETIVQECREFAREYGYNYDDCEIGLLLSDIYAYKLSQPDSANHILQSCEVAARRSNPMILNMIKSKRADLLTFNDNPWEATILYTQIEKSNPNDDIGYEAKLKKAWLAYYSGDLLWAKAQFDVLKGATTKLIANDAIRMAHFLATNYEEDSDNIMITKLAQTEYLIYKKQNGKALPILDSIISNSNPGISEYATLRKAELLSGEFRYDDASLLLEKLRKESEQTYIQAEAIYDLAGIKTRTKDNAKARELYKQLVSEYPGSVYSIEASRLYRELEKTK